MEEGAGLDFRSRRPACRCQILILFNGYGIPRSSGATELLERGLRWLEFREFLSQLLVEVDGHVLETIVGRGQRLRIQKTGLGWEGFLTAARITHFAGNWGQPLDTLLHLAAQVRNQRHQL